MTHPLSRKLEFRKNKNETVKWFRSEQGEHYRLRLCDGVKQFPRGKVYSLKHIY